LRSNETFFNVVAYGEKTDEKISCRMANILSWMVVALLGAASAVVIALLRAASAAVIALLVWNGFLYLEYLRQPPLARPFSHGSFALVGDDDDWTFKPQFPENATVSFGSSGASATRYDRSDICAMAWPKAPGEIFRKIGRPQSRRPAVDLFMIFVWKSNRAKTRVRDNLKRRANGSFSEATSKIASAI
jgi:hypothetical protein